MISVILKNENGEIIPGQVLPIYPNGMHADMLSSNTPTDLLDGRDTRGMTIFCAADSCRAKILKNYTLKSGNVITLRKLENGGSLISSGGLTRLPNIGTSALISNLRKSSSGKAHISISNVVINGDKLQSAIVDMGQPVILENNRGVIIRLTIKEMILNAIILEYENIPPSSPRPDPLPPSASATPPESVASDDSWEPLPIDRGNPLYEEAVETLEVATEAIRESNGYAVSKKDERDEVVSNLEIGLANLKTEDTISSDKVEKIFYALKTAGKVFSRVTIEGGKISAAILSMMALAKAIWPWLPWLTVLPI